MSSMPEPNNWPLCLHGDGSPAVARFRCAKGCVSFPGVLEQDLCAQHIVNWGFLDDDAEVIAVYHEETARRLRIIARRKG